VSLPDSPTNCNDNLAAGCLNQSCSQTDNLRDDLTVLADERKLFAFLLAFPRQTR
jgi:hypothetical protein